MVKPVWAKYIERAGQPRRIVFNFPKLPTRHQYIADMFPPPGRDAERLAHKSRVIENVRELLEEAGLGQLDVTAIGDLIDAATTEDHI